MSNKHYGKLIAVVIRHLQDNRPVVSAIINESSSKDVDDQIGYLMSEAKEHVHTFIAEFVEFSKAVWYIDICEESSLKVVTSECMLEHNKKK
ncbi:MAG: hypothetical protein HGA35_01500 [Erysipelotrichaceae bacterium]|nr:hypothetical protein [Erysipelotrichaceae bacterium]